MTDFNKTRYSLTDLKHVMHTLRAECPWDKVQTPESLTRYAIEEAYEVESAVREGDVIHIKEELGDLLFQVIFQSCLFEEQGAFNFDDVIDTLAKKMIRRHPHVYDKANPNPPTWQEIKAIEKQAEIARRPHLRSILSSIKPSSPLMQAQQLQTIAGKVGFDWIDVSGARDKMTEELAELDDAIVRGNKEDMLDELGDCFFALTNVARKLELNSEMALLSTIHKFRSRFSYIEAELQTKQKSLEDATLEEMDLLWNEAKKIKKYRATLNHFRSSKKSN